jgi:predicted transcriptional regulator of viral defense system
MEPKNAVLKALPKITHAFEQFPKRIFTAAELRQIVSDQRETWHLGETTLHQFIQVMTKASPLKELRLGFPYRPAYRYAWSVVTTFELAQSLNDESYFSHYTALHLHELTEQVPKTIYLNIEQPKKPGGGTLTQAGIDRAFKGKCRISTNSARYQDRTICLLNGANTGRLGVIEMQAPDAASPIQVTNLERTLIDATVRPIYAGGVFEVRKAFAAARDRVSSNKLAAYLRKLNYTYPYHQSVGFYMQDAGYKSAQVELMRQFNMEYDFYLDYQMKETDYRPEWRLYVPKGF